MREIVVGVLLVVGTLACDAERASTGASVGNPPDPTSVEGHDAWESESLREKLSPATKRWLAERRATEQVDLLIRSKGRAGPQERARLEGAGARVRSVAGDVATATAPADALERIAALDFVVYVDVSRPLQPEAAPE